MVAYQGININAHPKSFQDKAGRYSYYSSLNNLDYIDNGGNDIRSSTLVCRNTIWQ